MSNPVRGLFVTGTDTNVGKTYISALIARSLVAAGRRVGVYKPVASGCDLSVDGGLISEDALELWKGAGHPGELDWVCPQRFREPLAPNLAAHAEGRNVDAKLLRTGLSRWLDCSEVVIVEGVGGLMSPVTDNEFIADLADDFGFPLVVVVRNTIGAINQTLQTLIAAKHHRGGLPVAGIVLNLCDPNADKNCTITNRDEIARHSAAPILAEIQYLATDFAVPIDWFAVAAPPPRRS